MTAAMKLKDTCSLERYDKLRQHMKKRRHHFADKAVVFPVKARKPYSQSYGFSSSHEWMWELEHKEGWVLKNWCFRTVVLEKIFESPFDCKEIKPLSPEIKPEYSWKDWCWSSNPLAIWCEERLFGKDPDAGKDLKEKEKGAADDEMVI